MRRNKYGMTEKLFQGRVEQSLKVAGFQVYHTWNSMHSTKGFPDIVAIHPKRKKIVVIEVKTETGIVRPEQNDWLTWFSLCGIDARVLRPSMFDEFWEEMRK